MTTSEDHPVPSGAKVAVFSTAMRQIEGWARIISPFGEEPHLYLVQFENEALPQVRVVLREWQTDPAHALEDSNSGRQAMPDATLVRAWHLDLLSPRVNKFAA